MFVYKKFLKLVCFSIKNQTLCNHFSLQVKNITPNLDCSNFFVSVDWILFLTFYAESSTWLGCLWYLPEEALY